MESSKRDVDPEQVTVAEKSCWDRRSKLERCLVYLVVLFVVVCAALAIALAVVNNRKDADMAEEKPTTGKPEDKICMTTECVNAASRIDKAIDYDEKPCEDFYAFACGSWMKTHVIPEDRSEMNTFGILYDEVEVILKNLLEDEDSYVNQSVFDKPKDLYASCVNLEKLEELKDEPLRAFQATLGGWPMVDPSWDEANFNLTQMLIQMRLLNNEHLIDISVSTDSKNSSSRILMIDQPELGLPGREYYLRERNDSNIMAYELLMRNIAMELGGDAAIVEKDVKDVVDFEIQVANISVPKEDRRDSEALYNLYTLSELAENFTGAIDWHMLFHGLFNHEDIQIPLAEDEPIVNWSPSYFTKLIELLNNTSSRTLANFLVWRITRFRANNINQKYRDFILDYNKVVYGIQTARARFRTCTSYVTAIMTSTVGHMFVQENFDEEAKAKVLELIGKLKEAFNELLDDVSWMDKETKKKAREKGEAMGQQIGYPDAILNVTYLTKINENYTYEEDEYFENVVTNIEQSARSNLRLLRMTPSKDQWYMAPSDVNAYYSSLQNQIVFPAGILQKPFYSKDYPQSLNYGGIGFVIGHELTHGFDDRGRQYDKDGNLDQWWSDEVIEKFKEQTQCMINQYGNYTVPEADMTLNGINTQGENIADNGGLKQSFKAYRNWIREERKGQEEQLLPGLNFSNNQLFFINAAQIWCTNMRKQRAINRVLTGYHSPGQFRVIGPLQNSEDFAKAFGCPKRTSYMNPANKCSVW